MQTTDFIVLGILAVAFIFGFMKGLLRILVGPLALIIGIAGAYIYYINTEKLLLSLGICFMAPLVLKFIFSLLFKALSNKDKKEEISPIGWSNRFLGGTINALWTSVHVGLFLCFIILLPFQFKGIKLAQKDIANSHSYKIVYRNLKKIFPMESMNMQKLVEILSDPKKLKEVSSSKEYRSIAEDPRVEDLLSDEETVSQMKSKNYGKLIANPKMQAILNDKELLTKFFELNKKITQKR